MNISTLTSPASFESAMLTAKQQKLTEAALPANMPSMDEVEHTAKEFEAVFLSEMLSHMFKGVKTDPLFGGGRGEEIYRSMMVQEYGKQLAHGGGVGIADNIKQAMIDMQAQINKGQEVSQ